MVRQWRGIWRIDLATLVCLLVWGQSVCQPGVSWCAERLDDSLSPRQAINVRLRWAHQGDTGQASDRDLRKLVAVTPDVEVRLNTQAYVGNNVRVFLALPIQISGLSGSGGFRLSWETRGGLAPGATTPGNRSLLFKGPLNDPLLIDYFTFTLEVDANRLTGELRYAPIFEIEVD